MNIYKIPIYIILIVCLIITYGLFFIKDNVMTIRFELQEVKNQLQTEENAIRILQAELAYLGSPERIQKLAAQYLKLEKPKANQIISDPLIANQLEQIKIFANENNTIKKSVKWRYKKGPTKYLTMVKGKK